MERTEVYETESALKRRTLKLIQYYPSVNEIYERIVSSPGWPYKTNLEYYRMRDQALCALVFLLGGRVSEILRLRKSQFEHRGSYVLVKGIKLSKSRIKVCRLCRRSIRVDERLQHLREAHGLNVKDAEAYFAPKPRREQYREEAWLPLTGERAPLTDLVLRYLRLLQEDEKLFKFTRVRAWQIINCILGVPPHWLRAFCENYLYEKWSGDILAVSDYIKVDVRTLQLYIRKRYRKYRPV